MMGKGKSKENIIMKCNYRPFVWEIHRWPVDCPHKKPVMRIFDDFADAVWNKLMKKQSGLQWFETP